MIRIYKHPVKSGMARLAIRLGSIGAALLISAVIIGFLGYNPPEVYLKIIEKSLGTPARLVKVLTATIPLAIVGAGVSVAFKMKFWNIGAEGQMLVGATCASYLALQYPTMAKPLLLACMLLASLVGGGLYALIAGFFRVKFRANETLFTLMLNYIALKFVIYLQAGPWKDPARKGMQEIARFSENARLPSLFGVHIGWIFALVILLAYWVFFRFGKRGFEVSVVGQSELTARYVGMNVPRVMLLAVFVSGAVCGLAGAVQASAVAFTLTPVLTGGRGFTAIIIAWLSSLSALSIAVTAFFFSVLTEGSSALEASLKVPPTLSDMLQGIVLFCVLGAEFFLQYRIARTGKGSKAL